jgi:RNAse (barnase) inhibitor barstar
MEHNERLSVKDSYKTHIKIRSQSACIQNKLKIIINGDNFSDLESFHGEIDQVLTRNLSWQTGHNLNAFNDLVRRGFGVYDYLEPVKITWIKFSVSTKKLGDEVIDELLAIIHEHEHISNLKPKIKTYLSEIIKIFN